MSRGTWWSSAFDPTLRFDTTTDLVVIEHSREALTMVLPGSEGSASVTLLVPLAVGGAENRPVAPPDDFESYIEELEALGVVAIDDVGRMTSPGGEVVQFADITVQTPAGFESFPCRLGPDCLWVMRTQEGGDVHVRVGAPVRIVARNIDGVPVRVVATADDATFARVADEALTIALSVEPDAEASASASAGDPRFLSSISTRESTLPAGRYLARLGDVGIVLDLEADLPGFSLQQVEVDFIVFGVAGVGRVSIVQPIGYADPQAAQVNSHEVSGRLLADPPTDAVAYGGWLDEFFSIASSETVAIGGFPATDWHADFDERTPFYECGPPLQDLTGGRCVSLFTTSLGWWSTQYVEADVHHDGFGWYVDGPDLLVSVGAEDDRPDNELWHTVAPLLDAITFEVSAEM